MKKILMFITMLSLAIPNITAADQKKEQKKSSSSGWKTAAAVGTALAGALILVTGGAVAYDEWKKGQAKSKLLEADMAKTQEALKEPHVEAKYKALFTATSKKLIGEAFWPFLRSDDYSRMGSLILSTLLKNSAKAREVVRELANFASENNIPIKPIYVEIDTYLKDSLANNASSPIDPERLVKLWEKSPKEVKNFIEGTIMDLDKVIAESSTSSKIEEIIKEVNALK